MYRIGALALLSVILSPAVNGQSTVPSTFDVLADDFEAGNLDNWLVDPDGSIGTPVAAASHSGSLGLLVSASLSRKVVRAGRREIARADEAYLTFWFDPNSVAFNDTGTGSAITSSLLIGAIEGENRKIMVGLRVRQVGGNYEAFIGWREPTSTKWMSQSAFSLVDGWQEITLGFRSDSWVSCWIGSTLKQSVVTNVDHSDEYGAFVEIGQLANNANPPLNPSGSLYFDDVSFHLPRITDLWVDQASGSDSNDGLTPGTPFATISRAADLAGAGTTVHILPGTYRESVAPAQGGLTSEPTVFTAENGPGTVVIRGSEASSTLAWTQLGSNTIGLPVSVDPTKVWWTDLSSWSLAERPRFVVSMGPSGQVQQRLPLAREPDWTVQVPYKHSELWWTANGGSSVAACDPTAVDDCDVPSRSDLQLTDTSNDTVPTGIEPGNLSTLGDLTGAEIIARDTRLGHFIYTREIVVHDIPGGRVTVDSQALLEGGLPGLGWGTQYFVQNQPQLLDSAGEWWFDSATNRLYLWPPVAASPATLDLEISRLEIGFDLLDRSFITVSDLDIELFNETLVKNWNFIWDQSLGNTVRGCNLRYGDKGIWLSQTVEAGAFAQSRIEDFLIEDNEISQTDYLAIHVTNLWDNGSEPDSWVRPGVHDVVVRNNYIHHAAFKPPAGIDSPDSVVFRHADHLTFEANTVADVAHNGVMVNNSVIQSVSTWGLAPSEIKTGHILIKDNLIERACQLMADCGALKVWGLPPDNHVFRDLLVIGNTLRDTVGWSWPGEARGSFALGQIPGAGGSGLYMDNTTGLHAYRNVAYNNGLSGFQMNRTWRDDVVYIYNNVLADNLFGLRLTGLTEDLAHANTDTQIRNNIFINNEAFGIRLGDADLDYTNTQIDLNLYFSNGWGSNFSQPGNMNIFHDNEPDEFWPTLTAIQANTPFESSGQAVDPDFLIYNSADHNPFDESRPDFQLLSGSPAVEAGTSALPASLQSALNLFGLLDPPIGTSYDQGAFEGGMPCDDLLLDLTVSTAETYQSCGTITLGSNFRVAGSGAVLLAAGKDIVFLNGATIESGVTLSGLVGQLP